MEKIKPKIGFIGADRQSVLEDLYFAIKNGFDYYEIQGLGEKFDFKPEVTKEIKKIAKNNNISLNLHAIQFLPISSLIQEVSEAALKVAKKEIALANKIGAKRITIHSGHKEMPKREIAVAKNFKVLIKNLKEIVKFGEKYGIKIGLENSFRAEALCRKPEDLLRILNLVKGLGITFDIGHANLINLNPINYFKKVKDFVINVHIHDNDGREDQHNLIGEGNINFNEFLKECKNSNYYGPFILEIFPHESALKGKEIFLNLWSNLI
jgi:sugar phosphate isomerase/epimerase